jgi:exonuclease VII large subunit
MEKDAYTVSAIGHSGDSTLLDAVSDARGTSRSLAP